MWAPSRQNTQRAAKEIIAIWGDIIPLALSHVSQQQPEQSYNHVCWRRAQPTCGEEESIEQSPEQLMQGGWFTNPVYSSSDSQL